MDDSNSTNMEEDSDDKEEGSDDEEDDSGGERAVAMKTGQEDEEQDTEEESNKPASPPPSPAAAVGRRRTRTQGRPRKRRATTTTTPVVTKKKQQQKDDNKEEEEEDESSSSHVDVTCPHCQKSFASVHGLKYHVQKLVCQPKPCPGCRLSFPTLLALRYHQYSDNCTGILAARGNEREPDDSQQQQQQRDNDVPATASSHISTSTGRRALRSSPRRNRARINYSLDTTNDDTDEEEEEEEVEDDDDDDEEEEKEVEEESEQADGKEADELSDDAGGDDDDDDDSDFSESNSTRRRPKKRLKRSTSASPTKKQQQQQKAKSTTTSSSKWKTTPAAAPSGFSCQYCNRKFKGNPGLRYHIDFFVCRPNQRPGGPVRKGKRKKAATAATATTADADADAAIITGSNSKFKRIRGSLNDRTCVLCSRVFTSVLGLQYHIEKQVCQQVKQDAALAFPTLQSGMKFDTPYGVVQVVRDDSAVPTARLRSDLRNSARHYTNAKIKHEIKITRNIQSVAVTHLARRKRLRHLYERSIMTAAGQDDLMNQSNVFACYFGKDPRLIPRKEHVAQPTAAPLKTVDPCAPEGSFPDRIVECILVKDKRDRYSSLEEHAMRASKKRPSQDNDNEPAGTDASSSTVKPTRLFLRRRMLTEPYSETTDLLTCQDCGTVFTSRPGCTYHVNSKVCFQKIDTGKEETRERIELMDKRAIAYLLQREKRVVKGLEERAMPIDFILSLTSAQGMMAESALEAGTVAGAAAAAAAAVGNATTGSVAPIASKKKPPPPANPVQKLDKTIIGDPKFKDPRLILAELKAQRRYQQSILCGPMYPSVFKALGYKKPRKPPVSKKRPRPKPKPKAALPRPPPPRPTRRQPVATLPPNPPPPQKELVTSLQKSPVHPQQDKQKMEKKNKMQPPPSATNGRFSEIVKAAMPPRRKRDRKSLPIFDTRPLAAEVRAGRYPTVKARRSDDPPHSPNCSFCQKVVRDKKNPQRDPLLPCDFCEKQVHLSCMLTKLIIKEPEPGEDFMCYYCINCLCSRRARAERRRLEKLTKESSSSPSSTVPVLDVTSTIVITQHRFATDPSIVPVKDLVSFTDQAVEGREYDCVVAQGRRLHDLVELTRDAQKRLAQHAETARMNAARQQMLDL